MQNYVVTNAFGLRAHSAPNINATTTRKLNAGEIVPVSATIQERQNLWALLHNPNPEARKEYIAIRYSGKQYAVPVADAAAPALTDSDSLRKWINAIDAWARSLNFAGVKPE